MSSSGPVVKTPPAPKFPPMELRTMALNPPGAPPFPEGHDLRERMVAETLTEQDVRHEGVTLAPRTTCKTKDLECQVSRLLVQSKR